jgi:serine/threonine protein kinase
VACGMKYLHSQRILFRDLKPPNVGLRLDGQYVLFDFGLAKELKVVDLVEEPDFYKATGMTGTRVFMAPEVAMFRPYGLSADVYSFAMFMWEVMAMKMVFSDMSSSRHYESVVLGNVRPRTLQHSLPTVIHDMMVRCWNADPKQRPTFDEICLTLNDYLSKQDTGGDGGAKCRQLQRHLSNRKHTKRIINHWLVSPETKLE